MISLGSTLSVDDVLSKSYEDFVGHMYDRPTHSSVNELCYYLFCTSSLRSYADLLPTDDALLQRVKRSTVTSRLFSR